MISYAGTPSSFLPLSRLAIGVCKEGYQRVCSMLRVREGREVQTRPGSLGWGPGPGAGFNIRGQAAESEAGLLRHQDRVPFSARRDNIKIISADAP